MSKNNEVNIDITATDDASKIIKDVAKKTDALDKEKAEVGITADDDASKVIEGVESDVKALDKEDVEITLKARADALKGELRSVKSDLDALERESTTVEVDADVEPAKRKLADVEDAAGRSGGGAGNKFGAGFVRDVGGPLAEGTAGVLGDISDAFATAGESIGGIFGERFGGKVGPAVAGIGAALGTAVAVGGAAYVAIDTLWKLFKDKGDKAVDDAIKKMEGAFDTLADTFQDEKLRQAITDALTPDQMSLLGRYGIFLDDIVGLIRGEPIAATKDLEEAFRQAIGVLGPGGLTGPAELAVFTLQDRLKLTADEAQKLYDKASKYREIEGILNTQTGAVGRLRDQFRDTQAFVQGGTRDVETFGRTIRGLPADKAIAIYPDLRGEQETEEELNRLARNRTSTVTVQTRLAPGFMNGVPPWMIYGSGRSAPAGGAAAPSEPEGIARLSEGLPAASASPSGAAVVRHEIAVKVDMGNGVVTDPNAVGRFIAQHLETYLRTTGQLPLYGSVWR